MQVVSYSEAHENFRAVLDRVEADANHHPLRRNLSGCWARRIDDEHRRIYRLEENTVVVLACRYHHR